MKPKKLVVLFAKTSAKISFTGNPEENEYASVAKFESRLMSASTSPKIIINNNNKKKMIIIIIIIIRECKK